MGATGRRRRAEVCDVCSRKTPLAPELRMDGRVALWGAGKLARAHCNRAGEHYWHLRPGSRGVGRSSGIQSEVLEMRHRCSDRLDVGYEPGEETTWY